MIETRLLLANFLQPCYNPNMFDFIEANRKAWNKEANTGNAWSRPVDDSLVEMARNGNLKLRLAITNDVPPSWVDGLRGKDVLNLGGAGGQQTVLLAAYGCSVTTVDISDEQLKLDAVTLERHGLAATLHSGSLTDLGFLSNDSFDCVVSPGVLNFIPKLENVYKDVHRLLRKGGRFMFSIANPALYMFDQGRLETGRLKLKYTLPFASDKALSPKQFQKLFASGGTVEYSHTLDDILGTLCSNGFSIEGYLSSGSDFEPIDSFLQDCYFSVLAVKKC